MKRNLTVGAVTSELKANADSNCRESGQQFSREPVRFYGVRTSVVRAVAKCQWDRVRNPSKAELLALCEELLAVGKGEERGVVWRDAASRPALRHREAAGNVEEAGDGAAVTAMGPGG